MRTVLLRIARRRVHAVSHWILRIWHFISHCFCGDCRILTIGFLHIRPFRSQFQLVFDVAMNSSRFSFRIRTSYINWVDYLFVGSYSWSWYQLYHLHLSLPLSHWDRARIIILIIRLILLFSRNSNGTENAWHSRKTTDEGNCMFIVCVGAHAHYTHTAIVWQHDAGDFLCRQTTNKSISPKPKNQL